MNAAVCLLLLTFLWLTAPPARAGDLPGGYWPTDEVDEVLRNTRRIHLQPDLSELTAAEREVLRMLLEAGEVFADLYAHSRHHQAREALSALRAHDARLGSPSRTQDLLLLFDLFQGPVATTPGHGEVAFLPVDPRPDGGSLYPAGVRKEEIDAFLALEPSARVSILHPRTAVRRAVPGSLDADLATLDRYPLLDGLHPDLRGKLERLRASPSEGVFYAVPYSVAFPVELLRTSRLLSEASAAIAGEDPDFSKFLRLRSLDLLTGDFEAGDAAWVRGHFPRLVAQVGSYETYDDRLYATKAHFGLSVLIRDEEESRKVERALDRVHELAELLPYEGPRTSRRPAVGVYDVIADFGQARGLTAATILPNEKSHVRKYGWRILLRRNILADPGLFGEARAKFQAAVAERFRNDLTPKAYTDFVLWHEIGHSLAPVEGEAFPGHDGLGEYTNVLGELLADLVSVFATPWLEEIGYHDGDAVRAMYADATMRAVRNRRPRPLETYPTMHLLMLNFLMEKGALHFRPDEGVLDIRYDRFHEAATAMLREVIQIHVHGDRARAAAFVERYSAWTDDVHQVLAAKALDAMRGGIHKRITFEELDRHRQAGAPARSSELAAPPSGSAAPGGSCPAPVLINPARVPANPEGGVMFEQRVEACFRARDRRDAIVMQIVCGRDVCPDFSKIAGRELPVSADFSGLMKSPYASDEDDFRLRTPDGALIPVADIELFDGLELLYFRNVCRDPTTGLDRLVFTAGFTGSGNADQDRVLLVGYDSTKGEFVALSLRADYSVVMTACEQGGNSGG